MQPAARGNINRNMAGKEFILPENYSFNFTAIGVNEKIIQRNKFYMIESGGW